MQESKFSRRIGVIVPALSAAVVAAFALAAWSFYASHQQACQSRNATLTVIHDILVIATTPAASDRITPDQRDRLDAFRSSAFDRINDARC
jgi:hypothetical protein